MKLYRKHQLIRKLYFLQILNRPKMIAGRLDMIQYEIPYFGGSCIPPCFRRTLYPQFMCKHSELHALQGARKTKTRELKFNRFLKLAALICNGKRITLIFLRYRNFLRPIPVFGGSCTPFRTIWGGTTSSEIRYVEARWFRRKVCLFWWMMCGLQRTEAQVS